MPIINICRGTGCKVKSSDPDVLDSHILNDTKCASYSYTLHTVDDAETEVDDAVA